MGSEYEDIVRLYATGVSLKRVSAELNVPVSRVRKILLSAGAMRRQGGADRPIPSTKRCTGCGETKPVSEFPTKKPRSPAHKARPRSPCHQCMAKRASDWHGANKQRVKRRRRKSKYGLDHEDFTNMVEAQGGQCAVCLKGADLVVDHDHNNGAVRGLLCGNCNRAIGLIGDNADSLRRAAEYLEK